MTDNRKIVRVFLASPGDLQDERRAAKVVVDEFNGLWADTFGYQVELVGWEETVSGYGRPQSLVNQDLERCELFIGMMWKRWGTPPSKNGPYSSGFEEEFEISIASREKAGRPSISLLFKDVPPDLLGDPGEDLRKVISFKARIVEEKKLLFESFADGKDFENKVRRCITRHIQRLKSEEERGSDESRVRGTRRRGRADAASKVSPKTPLSVQGAKFAREFIAKTERDPEKEPIEPVEIARFRLLGRILGKHGNDDAALGVHDANLLFARKQDVALGFAETHGLVDSGLEHFSAENTPLWHWYAAIDGFQKPSLAFLSFICRSNEQRAGALAAMRLIQEQVLSSGDLNREFFIDSWFGSDSPTKIRTAALEYLGECGDMSDIPAIRKELERADYQTTAAATDATLRVTSRSDTKQAIQTLYEFQPASIPNDILTAIYDDADSFDEALLRPGLQHRSASVRRLTLEILRNKNALDKATVEKLVSDSDLEVRLDAVKWLVERGQRLSGDEIKQILVRPATRGLFGIATENQGDECWQRFRKWQLQSMPEADLERIAVESRSVFDREADFVLSDRQFATRAESLRNSVSGLFKAEFDEAVADMERRYGEDSADLVAKTRSLEEHVRKKHTRKGLDIILRHGSKDDLSLVRRVLESGYVEPSEADLEYLEVFGEWQDIALVVSLVERSHGLGASILLISSNSRYSAAARAIYSIGRGRLAEILTMAMPAGVLSRLIAAASEADFNALADESINVLFRSSDDNVRKAGVLKCALALSKARMRRLLERYVSGDQYRYYNVIHWLDFGVSTPEKQAVSAASRVMASMVSTS